MNSELDNIYGDGIGYVHLLETMGDQYTPAEDARTSTNKGRLGPKKDAKLQDRLLRDAHTSPFEAVIAKFELCVPLFVLRELDRHRTLNKVGEDDPFEVSPEEGLRKWFSRNEMSGRYVQLPDLYYHPQTVRTQSKVDKQTGDGGSISSEDTGEFLRRGKELSMAARDLYSWAVERGVEKGQARIYNTQNQYTKIRLTGNLKNWCDFLTLRLEPGVVLWECRQVAVAIKTLLTEAFPAPMNSWMFLVYDGVHLTRQERLLAYYAVMDALNKSREERHEDYNEDSYGGDPADEGCLGLDNLLKKLKGKNG